MDPILGSIIIALVSGGLGYAGVKYKSKTDLDGIKTSAEDKAAADLFGAYDKFVDRFSKQLDQERSEFEKKIVRTEERHKADREEWTRDREAILARMALEQQNCDERIALLEAKVTSLMQTVNKL